MRTQRRSQADRSRSTRTALVTAARSLFAERGYADVSAEELVRAAGVTRGALYHHYGGKQDLFRDVFERLEEEVTAEIAAAAGAAAPAGEQARMAAALGKFLDICQRPEVLRIALTDAPATLGWPTWREIEGKYGLGLIAQLLDAAHADHELAVEPTPALAQVLLSSVIEAALLIAHSDDPSATREQCEHALLALLSGLFTPS